MGRVRLLFVACIFSVLLPAANVLAQQNTEDGLFFDDFALADTATLAQHGWTRRTQAGHPGISDAQWDPEMVQLVSDEGMPGNGLLRLKGMTQGVAGTTRQSQICQQRRFFEGTYAARVRFSDLPVQGPPGDVVVQSFYAVAPLRFDFDPQFSEVDWEYLPNGGWGDTRTRLYGVSWQTVQIEPWNAFNQSHQWMQSMDGWHILVMQVARGQVRMLVDGVPFATHGGRNYPVVPMSINFNLWFSPGGALPGVSELRVYQQEVDWVFHRRDQVMAHAEVVQWVHSMRAKGVAYQDSMPPQNPDVPALCNF